MTLNMSNGRKRSLGKMLWADFRPTSTWFLRLLPLPMIGGGQAGFFLAFYRKMPVIFLEFMRLPSGWM
ncbi:MAG: hypothetical protein A2259_00110 [Candidatus Moranbacteria bacterium RIFOXYA2_FULL_43_15]|nr:MAG: hypothetical protein A2259_00110 [Candidatus Moranbacteria bacterium RIFOXYA2_FULL_43_15]